MNKMRIMLKIGRKRDWIRTLAIKKPAEAGFFANSCLPKQNPINVWRTADDDVLYAGRLSYVQPDERHE
ncbi:hypothetical protein AU48_18700 [Salmonella enterica subsp. enterica serovar Enteritidis str. EC20120008]|nr:hypothetical protein AU24_18505 [Salmonella enterica subsp. enterica serovar Enteritidis str. EC20110361]AHO56614.1 hypothetical protein AU23_18465 [Salmonella enterica subsp. enterica serovar Enteritidis str. EC20110360]AHO60983.1 hypothetical protein AU21_18685 [Salmonella enterica subsp. enterica serovar Enteritidis str. EC20110359]AHO65313.1 hypothetical protein AU20_18430 [Salmonella enterica subsp. enterica serovar Enteritidis str. EC20110358]AHO69655.1 hypothetical protein AU19_18485 